MEISDKLNYFPITTLRKNAFTIFMVQKFLLQFILVVYYF